MGGGWKFAGPTSEPRKAFGILAKQEFSNALLVMNGRAYQQPSQFIVDRLARRSKALGLCIPLVPCSEVSKLDVDCAQQSARSIVA